MAPSSNDAKIVVERFLEEAQKGRILTSVLSGPALSRSKLINENVSAINKYKIFERDYFEQYSSFEVWTEQKGQVAVYQYHLSNHKKDGWKISLIEVATPSVSHEKMREVPALQRKIISEFISKTTTGADVRQYFAYPLRSTIKAVPPKLPNLKPASVQMIPVGGTEENGLINVVYVIDKKKISLLFHLIGIGDVVQISQIIPIE